MQIYNNVILKSVYFCVLTESLPTTADQSEGMLAYTSMGEVDTPETPEISLRSLLAEIQHIETEQDIAQDFEDLADYVYPNGDIDSTRPSLSWSL